MSNLQIALILGSGRSGTSLVTNIVRHLGYATTGTLLPADKSNPYGYFEDIGLIKLNHGILRAFGITDNLPLLLPEVLESKATTKFVYELETYLSRETSGSGSCFVLKDPRISALLPLYRRAFEIMGADVKPILCMRHPEQSVASLQYHYEREYFRSNVLWFMRVAACLEEASQQSVWKPMSLVHYEKLVAAPEDEVSRIADMFDTEESAKAANRSQAVILVKTGHAPRVAIDSRPLLTTVKELYAALLAHTRPVDAFCEKTKETLMMMRYTAQMVRKIDPPFLRAHHIR